MLVYILVYIQYIQCCYIYAHLNQVLCSGDINTPVGPCHVTLAPPSWYRHRGTAILAPPSWPRHLGHAIFATPSLPRHLGTATLAPPSWPRHLGHAIFATPSGHRHLGTAILATPSLPRHLGTATLARAEQHLLLEGKVSKPQPLITLITLLYFLSPPSLLLLDEGI